MNGTPGVPIQEILRADLQRQWHVLESRAPGQQEVGVNLTTDPVRAGISGGVVRCRIGPIRAQAERPGGLAKPRNAIEAVKPPHLSVIELI